jgi:hypothetical protein
MVIKFSRRQRRDFTGDGLHLPTLSNKERFGEQNERGHRLHGWVTKITDGIAHLKNDYGPLQLQNQDLEDLITGLLGPLRC